MGKTIRFDKYSNDGQKTYQKQKKHRQSFKKFVQKEKQKRQNPYDELPGVKSDKYDHREDDD